MGDIEKIEREGQGKMRGRNVLSRKRGGRWRGGAASKDGKKKKVRRERGVFCAVGTLACAPLSIEPPLCSIFRAQTV